MKRNSMRMLSLLLTLVMLLGAIPFASAADPVATITAHPGDTVWEGAEVDLMLVPSEGTATNIEWSTGSLNKDMITVTPTATTTYTCNTNLFILNSIRYRI